MQKIRLALDWTPNANHIGFFVALEKGFYQEVGLSVELQNPAEDNYTVTPAKRVELGQADLALCPTESLISYRVKPTPVPLLGIAALHREDLSAIAVLKSSEIDRPSKLDGKTYASYRARYEDGIVKAMIKNDGGGGELKITYPEKLGIWNRLLSGAADATWIFLNWEGVMADASEHQFNYFQLADFGIPYSYSPVIAGHADRLAKRPDSYRKFLAATKKGHLYSQENPVEAADILHAQLSEHDRNVDVEESLNRTLPYCGTAQDWGIFEEAAVQKFLDWLRSNGLEERHFLAAEVMTNEYLN